MSLSQYDLGLPEPRGDHLVRHRIAAFGDHFVERGRRTRQVAERERIETDAAECLERPYDVAELAADP